MLAFNKVLLAATLVILLIAGVLCSFFVQAHEPFPVQAYGYIPIGTKGSYMFYDFQGSPNLSTAERSQLPLLVWLSGGPGSPGGFPAYVERVGNTALEVDPTNSSNYVLVPSKYSWTKYANIIFPDSPLGSGFSTAATLEEFSTTDESVAANLVTMLQGFLQNQPEFEGHDLWLTGESYSGKIVNFLGNAILASGINLNLKGVTNDDGWTYPIGCMKSYGSFMRAHSLCNEAQAQTLDDLASQAEFQVMVGNGTQATNLWSLQQNLYSAYANGVNVYNIRYFYDYTAEQFMGAYFNSPAFRSKLPAGLVPSSKVYNAQDNTVFNQMSNAFMTDGTEQVQFLIDAGVSVNVLSGQMDLIVDTLCTRSWINKLPWSSLPNFQNASRNPFVLEPNAQNYFTNGFMQEYANFRFWNVVEGGHMSPLDQGKTVDYIVNYILNDGATSELRKPFEDGARLQKERAANMKLRRRLGV